jgi:hypothetical protein
LYKSATQMDQTFKYNTTAIDTIHVIYIVEQVRSQISSENKIG